MSNTDVEVNYEGKLFGIQMGETILDAVERQGGDIVSSCRAGACQCCLMRSTEGPIPVAAQQGLKESLKSTGHFLACICRPTDFMAFESAADSASVFNGVVEIQELTLIGPEIMRVRCQMPEWFQFFAGQFVSVHRGNGIIRSYSIATPSAERDFFDFHIRKIRDGSLSVWFHEMAKVGDRIWIQGPKGDCRYYPGTPEEPLTFVATGTGMAPLKAIAEDAIKQGHTGPIHIYQGAMTADRLYLVDDLSKLARENSTIKYIPCVMEASETYIYQTGDIKKIVLANIQNPKAQRIYLCGDPGLVRELKKKLFLAGVSAKKIHADPFI